MNEIINSLKQSGPAEPTAKAVGAPGKGKTAEKAAAPMASAEEQVSEPVAQDSEGVAFKDVTFEFKQEKRYTINKKTGEFFVSRGNVVLKNGQRYAFAGKNYPLTRLAKEIGKRLDEITDEEFLKAAKHRIWDEEITEKLSAIAKKIAFPTAPPTRSEAPTPETAAAILPSIPPRQVVDLGAEKDKGTAVATKSPLTAAAKPPVVSRTVEAGAGKEAKVEPLKEMSLESLLKGVQEITSWIKSNKNQDALLIQERDRLINERGGISPTEKEATVRILAINTKLAGIKTNLNSLLEKRREVYDNLKYIDQEITARRSAIQTELDSVNKKLDPLLSKTPSESTVDEQAEASELTPRSKDLQNVLIALKEVEVGIKVALPPREQKQPSAAIAAGEPIQTAPVALRESVTTPQLDERERNKLEAQLAIKRKEINLLQLTMELKQRDIIGTNNKFNAEPSGKTKTQLGQTLKTLREEYKQCDKRLAKLEGEADGLTKDLADSTPLTAGEPVPPVAPRTGYAAPTERGPVAPHTETRLKENIGRLKLNISQLEAEINNFTQSLTDPNLTSDNKTAVSGSIAKYTESLDDFKKMLSASEQELANLRLAQGVSPVAPAAKIEGTPIRPTTVPTFPPQPLEGSTEGVEKGKTKFLDRIKTASETITGIENTFNSIMSAIKDRPISEDTNEILENLENILTTACKNRDAYKNFSAANTIGGLLQAAELLEKSAATLTEILNNFKTAARVGEPAAGKTAAAGDETGPAVKRMWVEPPSAKAPGIGTAEPVGGKAVKTELATAGKGEGPPPGKVGSTQDAEKKQKQKELELLRSTYLKAKAHYESFQGVVGFFKKMLQGSEMGGAQSKMETAKTDYENKLTEYKASYLSQALNEKLQNIEATRVAEYNEQQQRFLTKAHEGFKKLGWWRLGISASFVVGGAFLGGGDIKTWLDIGRKGFASTGSSVGLFGLLQTGIQFLRERGGALREVETEKLKDMKTKEIGGRLAALELEAASRGLNISQDSRYVILLEEWGKRINERLRSTLDQKIIAADEALEKARGKERLTRRAYDFISAFTATALGAALGTGLIFNAVSLAMEAPQIANELATNKELAGTMQKLAKEARRLALERANSIQSLGSDAENTMQKLGVPANQAQETAAKIREAAQETANRSHAKGIQKLHQAHTPLTEQGLQNIEQATQEDAKTAGREALKQAIAETEEAARKAASAAGGEAAGAGGAGIGGEVALEAAAETAFRALMPDAQMRQIHDLISSAAKNSEATTAALTDIAQERFANKEFKTLDAAFIDTKSDYTKIANAVLKDHTTLADLANRLAGAGNKGLSLAEFEQLRNLSSWHGTPMGEAAKKLLLFVEDPKHNVLATSAIHEIEIGEPEGAKTLFDAFNQAEHEHNVSDATKINTDFAHFLEKYGVDAINANDSINQEIVNAAKKIAHSGEYLWHSADGAIISQEHETLKVGVDDELSSEEMDKTPPTEQKPVAQADTAATAPEAKPPAADQTTTLKKGGTPAPKPLEASMDTKVGVIDAPAMHKILEQVHSLKDLNSNVFSNIISAIQKNPVLFLNDKIPELKNFYTFQIGSRGIFMQALENEESEKNIKAIFEALLQTTKKPLVLLGKTFEHGKIEWQPKKS